MIWTEDQKEKARATCLMWQGTPHRHWMRLPGVGVDCVHFVVDVLEKAGVAEQIQIPRYAANVGRKGAEDILLREFAKFIAFDVVTENYQFGDILFFEPRLGINHVAILIDNMIWHALGTRAVDVNPFDDWKRSVKGAMRIK